MEATTARTACPRGLPSWTKIGYGSLACAVVLYVALTTGARDELPLADAWEHHRVVRVMAQLGFRAGNPTYATDDPSVRYSPYSALLALVVRWTRGDAWHVLSGAAVVNTALLMGALYLLLRSFRRQAAALPVLVVALLLYGSSPGYANTLALEDLPWHQVNPSASSLPLCVLGWATWRWAATGRIRLLGAAPFVAVAIAFALLSHAMTGTLGAVGLMAVAFCQRGEARGRLVLATLSVGAVAVGLCALWPYYPFLRAVRTNPEPAYWYNPAIVRLMLTDWSLPCLLASLLAIPYRREPLVEFGLWGLLATAALTLLAVATRSATFARFPLAGLIFAQVLTGYVLYCWNPVDPSTWPEALRGLRSLSSDAFVPAFARLLLPLLVLFFGAPQILDVLRSPHLMRPLIAGWLGRPDRQTHRFDRYRSILADVGEREVVLADVTTGWPVPSFAGRIVAAEHLEYFTPGQMRRRDDVSLFLTPGTPDPARIDLIERYGVRWILLDRRNDAPVFSELVAPPAVERAEGDMVLMDARRWLASRAAAGR